MATAELERSRNAIRRPFLTMASRRRLLRVFAVVVMTIYTLLTLFPFYALFVRSFVSTKD